MTVEQFTEYFIQLAIAEENDEAPLASVTPLRRSPLDPGEPTAA